MNTQKEPTEYTMDLGMANLIALVMIIPILIITVLPFAIIWDFKILKNGFDAFMDNFLLFLIGGIVVHELLHGITWGFFAKKRYKSIKYGFKLEFLTPYCHCKEPLKVKHYKIGTAMPLIVMGIIPLLTGLITADGGLLSFGIFFIITAGGDIIALYMLRKLDNNIYVQDHPEKMGFIREAE